MLQREMLHSWEIRVGEDTSAAHRDGLSLVYSLTAREAGRRSEGERDSDDECYLSFCMRVCVFALIACMLLFACVFLFLYLTFIHLGKSGKNSYLVSIGFPCVFSACYVHLDVTERAYQKMFSFHWFLYSVSCLQYICLIYLCL